MRIQRNFFNITRRFISTKCVEAKFVQNHSINIDDKPANWDEALPFSQIPGPKPLPIFKNTWRFLPKIGEYYGYDQETLLKILRQQFGDILYISGIHGVVPKVLCFNPNDVEKVFRDDGNPADRVLAECVHYYHNVTRKGSNPPLIAVTGEKWFKQRSVMNKYIMQPKAIRNYVPMYDEITDDLIENIRHFSKADPNNEMPNNFKLELYKWALECGGSLAFNRRLGSLSSNPMPELVQLIHNVNSFFLYVRKLSFGPSLWKYINTKKWQNFVQIADDIYGTSRKFFKESVSNFNSDPNIPEEKKNIVERLYNENPKFAESMAADIFTGGVDTTSNAFAYLLYNLAKNPKKQQILRNELKKHLPHKSSRIRKEMLDDVPYLKAVLKESSRISPVVAGIPRRTGKDLVLSGYQIPKGTFVSTMLLNMSHDEKNYIKPLEFIPERWLRSTTGELSSKNVNPFVSKPFGFGVRSCSGQRFANLGLEIGCAKIIRNFKLSWNYPDVTIDSNTILQQIKDPLKITVHEVED